MVLQRTRKTKLEDLKYLLEELLEYMDQRADVDDGVPNDEMDFCNDIEEALTFVTEELEEKSE